MDHTVWAALFRVWADDRGLPLPETLITDWKSHPCGLDGYHYRFDPDGPYASIGQGPYVWEMLADAQIGPVLYPAQRAAWDTDEAGRLLFEAISVAYQYAEWWSGEFVDPSLQVLEADAVIRAAINEVITYAMAARAQAQAREEALTGTPEYAAALALHHAAVSAHNAAVLARIDMEWAAKKGGSQAAKAAEKVEAVIEADTVAAWEVVTAATGDHSAADRAKAVRDADRAKRACAKAAEEEAKAAEEKAKAAARAKRAATKAARAENRATMEAAGPPDPTIAALLAKAEIMPVNVPPTPPNSPAGCLGGLYEPEPKPAPVAKSNPAPLPEPMPESPLCGLSAADTVPASPGIAFTLFRRHGGLLTKRVELDADNKPVKHVPAPIPDQAQRCNAVTLREVMVCLDGLSPQEAVGWGTHSAAPELVTVTLQDKLGGKGRLGPDVIARDREHFGWAHGPGVLMLDIDQPHEPEAARTALLAAAKAAGLGDWSEVEMHYRPSTSAGVEGLAGGGRLYVVAEKAGDIPRLGALLVQGLWVLGGGRVEASKAGTPLYRQLIDACVWEPERIDFAAPAVLGEGVVPAAMPAQRWWGVEGTMAGLPRESDDAEENRQRSLMARDREQRHRKAREAALADVREKLEEVRAAWVRERVREAEAAAFSEGISGDDLAEVRKKAYARFTAAAGEAHELGPDFVLHLSPLGDRDEVVTVAEILAEPRKWQGKACCDPLEPEGTYGKAKIYTRPHPTVRSLLHGGQYFNLVRRERETVHITEDTKGHDLIEAVRVMHEAFPDEFFRQGETLLRVKDGGISRLDNAALGVTLSCRMAVKFYAERGAKGKSGWSEELCRKLMASVKVGASHPGEGGTARELVAVSNAPLWDPGPGRVVINPGYDPETRIFLSLEDDWPELPEVGSLADAQALTSDLVAPYQDFPFKRPDGHSPKWGEAVALTCVLLAAVRRTVLGPVLMVKANRAGIGKTALCECVIAEMGETCTAVVLGEEEAEAQKALVAEYLNPRPCVLVDNHDGPFGGGCIEALTDKAPDQCIELRQLGANVMVPLYNDRLILANGISIRPRNEAMARRCLEILLVRKGEPTWTPGGVVFRFPHAPAPYIRANWKARRMAALALVAWGRGAGGTGLKVMPSMPDFSRDVRDVVWRLTGVDVCDEVVAGARAAAEVTGVHSARGRLTRLAWIMTQVGRQRPCRDLPGWSVLEPEMKAKEDVVLQRPGDRLVFIMKDLRDFCHRMRAGYRVMVATWPDAVGQLLQEDLEGLEPLLKAGRRELAGEEEYGGLAIVRVPGGIGLPRERDNAYFEVVGMPIEQKMT